MQLSFLGPLFDRPGPWATVYFDAAQNDEAGAKRRELSVREACRTLEEEGADAATVQAVREALTDIGPRRTRRAEWSSPPEGRWCSAIVSPGRRRARSPAGPRCPG
ncbi:hypothetical protein ACR6C2_03815 [Streptomyces sp. INA 01156]